MTTRARAAATAALTAVLVPLGAPAGAVPAVDRFSGGEAHLSFAGRDHAAYLVDISVRVSEVGTGIGTGTVTVTLRKCGSFRCGKPAVYRAQVTDANLSVEQDLSAGSLTVPLFGKPLSVLWSSVLSPLLPAYGVEPAPDGRSYVRVYRTTMVQALVAGMRCVSKEGLVFKDQVVDGDPPPAAPTAMPRAVPKAFKGMLGGQCQSILA